MADGLSSKAVVGCARASWPPHLVFAGVGEIQIVSGNFQLGPRRLPAGGCVIQKLTRQNPGKLVDWSSADLHIDSILKAVADSGPAGRVFPLRACAGNACVRR
jgi:hypothetical protein